MEKHVAVFQGKSIRRIEHQGEWWFSVADVCAVLTDSPDAGAYWRKLKQRLNEEGSEVVTNCHGLKLVAPDGKLRETDCANTEGMFRIIQSIPSPKAEPFKRWLAKVGYERVQEIEDPERATKRTRELYRAKGYSQSWIERRMRSIDIREKLTDEWKQRGVGEAREYAILTAEISKAAFGLTPTEYKELKGLERENLRDHMNDLELLFSMLGEAATTEIAVSRDSQGFEENKEVAREGGEYAGKARGDLEKKTGRKIVSRTNYLSETEEQRRKLKKD
ncbi:MAG: Bro-N domain-containing protein [Candidatus Omnitrophica bacterium]|nr:Bro-N domain-containing protein [Candidatus Omnitrophota bacterium]